MIVVEVGLPSGRLLLGWCEIVKRILKSNTAFLLASVEDVADVEMTLFPGLD